MQERGDKWEGILGKVEIAKEKREREKIKAENNDKKTDIQINTQKKKPTKHTRQFVMGKCYKEKI